MKAIELDLAIFELQSLTQHALLTAEMFKMLEPQYSEPALRVRLNTLTKKGFLKKVCRGVWLYPKSRYLHRTSIHTLVHLVRPYEINYLSQESVLSAHSIISQQMFDYITVMTTGRSGVFKTPLGTLELTHTKREPTFILDNTFQIEGKPLRQASIRLAYKDLQNSQRNLDMIDMDTLHEAIEEEEASR